LFLLVTVCHTPVALLYLAVIEAARVGEQVETDVIVGEADGTGMKAVEVRGFAHRLPVDPRPQ
jgi:hypothetical protein